MALSALSHPLGATYASLFQNEILLCPCPHRHGLHPRKRLPLPVFRRLWMCSTSTPMWMRVSNFTLKEYYQFNSAVAFLPCHQSLSHLSQAWVVEAADVPLLLLLAVAESKRRLPRRQPALDICI